MSQDIQQTPEEIRESIAKAHKDKDLSELARLTKIPADVIAGVRVMSRKERRQWYYENRKRLGLPKWSLLETLK